MKKTLLLFLALSLMGAGCISIEVSGPPGDDGFGTKDTSGEMPKYFDN